MVGKRKVFLSYDEVHLVKNIRNNLLAQKRIIFPPFQFMEFEDELIVPVGEVSWKLLDDVHEKDKTLAAKFREARKLTSKVRSYLLQNK